MSAKPIPPADSQASAAELAEDRLLDGRVHLRQPRRGYRAAIDAVFLAAAVPASAGPHFADLGTGAGAAALCLLARRPDCRVTGFELQPALARLAVLNARNNGAADRFAVHHGDIADAAAELRGKFDGVMANPPYLPGARADRRADHDPATVEGATGLAGWVQAALALARVEGTVVFIHRADRLDELLALLRDGAGGIEVLPLWPRQGEPAKRVVVRARRGMHMPLALAAGLVLHDDDGRYTEDAEAVLRGGRGLFDA